MIIDDAVLKNDEKAIFSLRMLYKKYGYSQYRMSKFEEYDLYVRNKDFLISDNIITFTDTDGKLMALKPDVTLSIIKNTTDEQTNLKKLYYDENVYRVSKGTNSFREIMQAGLECIGNVDDSAIYEVLMLACESLGTISCEYVLEISHLGIVSAIIEEMDVDAKTEKALLKCISEKNTHEIVKICEEQKVSPDNLIKIVSVYGEPVKVIPVLKDIESEKIRGEVSQLISICSALSDNGYGKNINIDFSVINDMNYYNGFVFKGFVNGIASGILSGGQYDKLMSKMGRSSGAVGFALYLDLLDRFN